MEASMLKLQSPRFSPIFLTLPASLILLFGPAMAQESLAEDEPMDMGPCEELRTVDWKRPHLNVFWSCADLRGVDLSGASMMDAYLTWSDLTGANLVGTDLSYGDLTGANFRDANLTGADLQLTTAMLANFTRANLVGTDFRNAYLLEAVFTEATFDRSTRWPELFDPVAKGAIDIDELHEDDSDMDMGPCEELRTVDWKRPHLNVFWSCADLRGVDLSGASMMDAYLTWSDLTGANLVGTDLSYGDLTGANFTEANLRGADLHLTTAMLANFTRANLVGTDFRDADLLGAVFTEATFDRSTRWPLLFDPVAKGAIDIDELHEDDSDMDMGPCEELRTVDWKRPHLNVFWSCADLRGVDLSGASMMDAYLTWSDLTGANLVGTDLSYGDLTGANFTEANLRGADLHLTTAMLANFTRANLVGTDFRDADLLGAVFTEATFDRSTRWPLLFDPVAKGAIDIDELHEDDSDMDMGPCEELRTVDWKRPHLNVFWSCADLRGVDLSGASMMDAYLTWSDLTGANLVGTDLSYGDLTGANFTEANLRGADLHLTTAMLANFTRANLVGTDFRDADLLGAVFTEATFDRSTRWPLLFDPVAKGAINIGESDSRNE